MGKFLARRLLNYVVLIFLATSFAYLLAATNLYPRGYFEQMQPPPTAEVINAQLDTLNLNDETPLAERYAVWLGGVVQGDFGQSIQGRDVTPQIWMKAGVTLRLITFATVLGAAVGIAVGAYSAVRQYRRFDKASTAVAFFVLSVPTVVIAISVQVGATAINDLVGFQLLIFSGEYSAGFRGEWWQLLLNRIHHALLPTIVLALSLFAAFARYQRNMMLDVLNADFVRTAMAKGLTRRRALFKHALRTALIPTITYFTFTFGIMVSGATFTEKIYGWHGMGAWLIDSISQHDVHVVAAVSFFMAVTVMAASFLSDILYAWLDPRVRV
ncbi:MULTISPECIES: ABC transporter permease [Nocardiopsidaceae]|uniref:ABC transporter permease n=2 Tax=Nocardiopsidaceae TaxID=83676 RepID=A0ABY6YJ61_9ACTN|nr:MULTISPECIES: ABC transporter permease [Nocardiopsaceae]MEE2053568.1 ABC transporter permease [Nocardiopsis umidischolae]WAE72355.1 ABC transporter permease [Streptomonospora nanhaiensis]